MIPANWVHLAPHIFQTELVDRLPGQLQILYGGGYDLEEHMLLNRRELPALDFHGAGAPAAEKAVDQGEDELGLEHHQSVSPQGLHPDDMNAGRHRQRSHEVAELQGIERHRRHVDHLPEQA